MHKYMPEWMDWKFLRHVLRYALRRFDILDTQTVDIERFVFDVGWKQVIELKDVGLNVKTISKLAQLPPGLRIETARVSCLRLSLPFGFRPGLTVELDGVEIVANLEEEDSGVKERGTSTPRSPTRARTPQHRKMNRRLHSPPPYDPGGAAKLDGDLHTFTAEDIAKSFLMDEPIQERRELEALAQAAEGVERSFTSGSSEGDNEVGTGGFSVPEFLIGAIQGIIDRSKVEIRDVQLKVRTELQGESRQSVPITLQIRVGAADLFEQGSAQDDGKSEKRRNLEIRDITVDLLSDSDVFSGPSRSSPRSPLANRHSSENSSELQQSVSDAVQQLSQSMNSDSSHQSSVTTDAGKALGVSSHGPRHSSSNQSLDQLMESAMEPTLAPRSLSSSPPPAMAASTITVDADRFADAPDDDFEDAVATAADLEIQPGDDNISWGSRRSKSSTPADDLWGSRLSENDLPDSLILPTHRPQISATRSQGSSSPIVERRRHPVSPYERNFPGPGSWPRPDQSPERHRLNHNPGSWPTLHRNHHHLETGENAIINTIRPFAQTAAATDNNTDNKQNALEYGSPPDSIPGTPSEPEPHIDESMLESRMFSHEEAQSMYMSAMSNNSHPEVPGGWASDTQSTASSTPQVPRDPAVGTSLASSGDGQEADALPKSSVTSGNATPRAQSPRAAQITNAEEAHVVKRLLLIDVVVVTFPSKLVGDEEISSETKQARMPGAFSTYDEQSSPRRRATSSVYAESSSVAWDSPRKEASCPPEPEVSINIGAILAQLDLSTGQALYRIATKIIVSLDDPNSKDPTSAPVASDKARQGDSPLSIHCQHVHVCIKEEITPGRVLTRETLASNDGLLSLRCDDTNLDLSNKSALRIGAFGVSLAGRELLSFKASSDDPYESQLLTERYAIDVGIDRSRVSLTRRPIVDVSVHTAPVHFNLDLNALDEAFSSFGGLSGILELSNSILTESVVNSPAPSKAAKGVRFIGEPEPAKIGPEIKLNARINGLVASLHGSSCSASVRTTGLKIVYREHGASLTISHLFASGPHFTGDSGTPPVAVDISSLRAQFALAPDDKDLERLITLLTPTKDKYDDDGEILIETLVRQRQKGSILRLLLGEVKVKVDNWDCLSRFAALGEDFAKLSAVTKYLPEDDRPGLLTMLQIESLESQLPVNARFGNLHVTLRGFQLAHVGLPVLFAFSVNSVIAKQLQGPELLHMLVPLTGGDALPLIMGRMLGDEVEHTIKLKLFNICIEYSVPIILALTDMDQPEPEELVNELAQSLATLAMGKGSPKLSRSPASDLSNPQVKKTNISVLVHDSAIGLTPQNLSSKAMVVLSDAHFATSVPPGNTMTAKLELRKASVLITDQCIHTEARPATSSHSSSQRVASFLEQQGFVSVGSIMSAVVDVRARDARGEDFAKAVEVDVRNELFLLETCADSTQTLFATLGALAPPTPPSMVPKYLTEPMPIEDMMASFTGDPFVTPEYPPETLFDAEEGLGDQADDILGVSTFDDDPSDLLAGSEMTSSLYGPHSGVFGMENDDEDEGVSGNYPGTVASLLEEEDPFEMPVSPAHIHLGDAALMRDLNRQCLPAVNNEPVDLNLYEIEDLGFDTLGFEQQTLGTNTRFNSPFPGRHRGRTLKQQQELPFRLRLRDFHLIWHLYDGYDWQRTRDGIAEAVEKVEQRAEERKARRRQSRNDPEDDESVIGDFLFNSIYIGVPADLDAQEIRRQINRNIDDEVSETESVPFSGISRPTTFPGSGQPSKQRQQRRLKLSRGRSHKISFELKGVSAEFSIFPPGSGETVSSVDLRLRDFEIFDKVPTSTWRKFLTHMNNDPAARELSKPMFHIKLENVKTLESHSASEIVLHVTVLPLRLHVDQDALDFITRFFEFKDPSMSPADDSAEKPFLQRVEIDTVDLCLDYKPKNVDYAGIRSGRTKEFMNFITLEGCNIRLRHAIVYGLKGFDLLHDTLNDVWVPDVTGNQLPKVLAGLAPVRSLVNLGTGVRDVIAIPIREYRKDGRIVRSIQKGASQFGKTTASELARLGAKVALGTQTMLSNAEELLAPGSAASRRVPTDQGLHDLEFDEQSPQHRAVSAYANQPLGLLAGLKSARRHLEHDLLTAKDALIAVQGEVLGSRGPGGVAGAVVKHAPTVILRPVIGTARAVGTTLLGVGNQIDRSNMRRLEDVSARPGWDVENTANLCPEIQATVNKDGITFRNRVRGAGLGEGSIALHRHENGYTHLLFLAAR
jgi:autophagy-related protein 2